MLLLSKSNVQIINMIVKFNKTQQPQCDSFSYCILSVNVWLEFKKVIYDKS